MPTTNIVTTISSKYQTVVPREVRNLWENRSVQLKWTIDEQTGSVTVTPLPVSGADWARNLRGILGEKSRASIDKHLKDLDSEWD